MLSALKNKVAGFVIAAILLTGVAFGAGTVTKGLIGMQDVAWWDGVTATFTRTSSSGYGMTMNKVNLGVVDVLQAYGGGSSRTKATILAALAAVGTTNDVTFFLSTGTWTISSNFDASAYTNVRWSIPAGAQLSHSTKTMSFDGSIDAGDYQIFSGTGQVTLASSQRDTNVRWFGAKGDNTTNDAAAFTRALAAAPNGSIVRAQSSLGFYVEATSGANGRAITIPSDKFVVFDGGGSTVITCGGMDGNDDSCIDIQDHMSTTSLKARISGFDVRKLSSDHIGTGIYIKDATFLEFDTVRVYGFNKGFWMHNDDGFCETNVFRHIKTQGCNYQWYLSRRCSGVGLDGDGNADATCAATSPASMSTCMWEDCIGNPMVVNGIGFYVGKGVSPYRSYIHMTMFPGKEGSIGYYIDGKFPTVSGFMNCEGQADKYGTLTNKCFYFGPNAQNVTANIVSHIIGCAGGAYDKSAALATPRGFFMVGPNGIVNVVWEGEQTNLGGARDSGWTSQEAIEAMTSASPVKVTITGHGLVTGDEVGFTAIAQADWTDLMTEDFTVTVIDDDNFTVAYDASAFAAYDPVVDGGKCRLGIVRAYEFISTSGSKTEVLFSKKTYKHRSTGGFANVELTPISDVSLITDPSNTTPSVAHVGVLRFAQGVATNVTELQDPTSGQSVSVNCGDSHTTFIDKDVAGGTANLDLQRDEAFHCVSGSTIRFVYVSSTTSWFEESSKRNYVRAGVWSGRPSTPRTGESYICSNCTDCGGTSNEIIFWNGTAWQCPNGTVENGP